MIDGIVSPCYSPDSGAIPSQAWIDALTALSPRTPLAIRASLAADAHDHIDVAALRAGLAMYRSAGMPVYLVIEQAASRYHALHPDDPALLPNAALGLNGDPTLNEFINRYSLAACSVLRQLGPDAGVSGVWIGNEWNLCACDLNPGDVPPPDKGSALSPEVAAATLWTTASRLRAEVPWLTTIWPASFSQLVYFFNGDKNNVPWFTLYWQRMLAYLTAHGKAASFPWDGMSVNLEGPVGHPLAGTKTPYVEYVAYTLSQVKSSLQITGDSCCGEWGEQVGVLDIPAMTGAYKALQASPFSHAFFYCAGSMAPGSYGAFAWSEQDGVFMPGEKTPIYSVMQALFTGGA